METNLQLERSTAFIQNPLRRPTTLTRLHRKSDTLHAFESRTLLGERFAGIVCSDRWRGYDYLDPNQRQLCWAHLLRDFTAHSEGMSEQHDFGCAGLVIAHNLFDAWEQYHRDGDRARLQAQITPLQAKLRTLL